MRLQICVYIYLFFQEENKMYTNVLGFFRMRMRLQTCVLIL